MTEPTRGDQEVGRLGVTTLTTGNAKENSYLVRDLESGEALLFDPGQDAEWILAEIRATGATVRRLLLTHAHFDHVGAAAEICAALGVPCELERRELGTLARAPLMALAFERRSLRKPLDLLPFDAPLAVQIGATTFEGVHAPGHTAGGIVFVSTDVVVCGDTLLNHALGRTDLPGGDAQLLLKTVDGMLNALPPGALLLPGHGRPWPASKAVQWWTELRSREGTA